MNTAEKNENEENEHWWEEGEWWEGTRLIRRRMRRRNTDGKKEKEEKEHGWEEGEGGDHDEKETEKATQKFGLNAMTPASQRKKNRLHRDEEMELEKEVSMDPSPRKTNFNASVYVKVFWYTK